MPAVRLIPLLIQRHFGGGALYWSWYGVSYSVGTLFGGLFFSTFAAKAKKYVLMLCAVFVFGVASIVQGTVPSGGFHYFIGATFAEGVTTALFFASVRVLIQLYVPPSIQGRIFSIQTGLTMGAGPIGLAVVGPFADVLGIQVPLLLRGIVGVFVGAVWLLSRSVRSIESADDGELAAVGDD